MRLIQAVLFLIFLGALGLFAVLVAVFGIPLLSEANLIVALTIYAVAIMTRSVTDGLASVDPVTREAAVAVGFGAWRRFWTIVFPQARAALVTVGIFAAVGAWNDFLGPLIYLQDQSVQTLSIGLQVFRLNNSQDFQFNQLMAASVLIILPLVVLFFVFQRTFLKGVQIGSFK